MKSSFSKAIAPVFFLVSSLQLPGSSALAQCDGTWTQSAIGGPAPAARNGHAMAYDSARGVTLLFGGFTSADGNNGETWEWDATNWTQRMPAAAPSARSSHTMAYDSARGVVVLFGGLMENRFYGETWEWDGTNWLQRLPAAAPSARFGHAMSYDAARGVTVLFGGYDSALDSETWEWDGTNWSQRFPAATPSVRERHRMAYDSARKVTVLFGGYTAVENGETWEWDGANWSQRFPVAAPTPRYDHAMDYDSGRGLTVLFGGYAGGFSAETWEWDGTIWTQRTPESAPSDRTAHSIAYDASRSITVLFGGYTGLLNGETWEWSGPTPAIAQQPVPRIVDPGQPAAFSIAADGPPPLTYRWRKDGAPLDDGGPIVGSTTATLTINPSAIEDSGSYDCVVSNPCGVTASRTAALVVDVCMAVDATGDCDGNGVLDNCDIAADAALDMDANGTLDSCEAADMGCGMCGGGLPAMMPLALIGLLATARRRRTPRFQKAKRSHP